MSILSLLRGLRMLLCQSKVSTSYSKMSRFSIREKGKNLKKITHKNNNSRMIIIQF